MLGQLIILFILVPLVDLVLLLTFSQYTDWRLTVALVVVSGIVGAILARRASASVSLKIREKLGRGQFDPGLLSDGAMIFFAAGLLLTPGFITDLVGFSILIPPIRSRYKMWLLAWVKRNFKVQVMTNGTNPFRQAPDDPNTVDGSVVNRNETTPSTGPPSIEQNSETDREF